jgi:hypothetical protein
VQLTRSCWLRGSAIWIVAWVLAGVTNVASLHAQAPSVTPPSATQDSADASGKLSVRAASDVAAYADSDHVFVLTPSMSATIAKPTAGWSVGGQYLVDVVSAASVDIVSTASRNWREVRQAGALDASYKPGAFGVAAHGALSVEPDYVGWTAGATASHDLLDQNVSLLLGLSHGHDVAGRTGTAFSVFSRKLDVEGLKAGATLVLDAATLATFVFDGGVEHGDPSKPYRYVPLFAPGVVVSRGASIDQVNALRVSVRPLEQLPLQRDRFSITAGLLHRFDASTLRVEERLYADTWAMFASTSDARFLFDLGDIFELGPHLRVHAQNAVNFWQRAYVLRPGYDVPALRTGDRELGPLVGTTLGMTLRMRRRTTSTICISRSESLHTARSRSRHNYESHTARCSTLQFHTLVRRVRSGGERCRCRSWRRSFRRESRPFASTRPALPVVSRWRVRRSIGIQRGGYRVPECRRQTRRARCTRRTHSGRRHDLDPDHQCRGQLLYTSANLAPGISAASEGQLRIVHSIYAIQHRTRRRVRQLSRGSDWPCIAGTRVCDPDRRGGGTVSLGKCARLCSIAWLLSACSLPAADERFSIEHLPDHASFPEVAQVLVQHCGTLDCHGTRGRNLRLYGNEGLRWAASDQPLHPACTTTDEIDQDYDSVVGLEPEIMSAVVGDMGARPERLTLIRKARGLESHKGGAPLQTGDDADRCLSSWLASDTDNDACLRALPVTPCFMQP